MYNIIRDIRATFLYVCCCIRMENIDHFEREFRKACKEMEGNFEIRFEQYKRGVVTTTVPQ